MKIFITVKLIFFLIVAFIAQATAGAMAQKIALKAENQALVTVLQELRKQSGYAFLYNEKDLAKAAPVTIHVQDKDLVEVLPLVFKAQPLAYEIKGRVISVVPNNTPSNRSTTGARVPRVPDDNEPLILAFPEFKGKIVDSLGKPLAGASIRVLDAEGKRTTLQTTTDSHGEFVLRNVPEEAVLEISFVGYVTQIATVSDNVGVIVLAADFTALEEALVTVNTGYQELPKERATGSFVLLDSTLINRRVSTNALERLEGLVPGLLFNRNTASAYAGNLDINIRGTNTLFAQTGPLIVVDGFAYDGEIGNINPNTIESITVLKDAAATSIWGVKSGNGVIVIQTKTGKKNQRLRIDFNTNATIGNIPDLYYNQQFLNSVDFIELEELLYRQNYYTSDLSTGYTLVSPVIALLASDVSDAEKRSQIEALKNQDVRDDLTEYFYRNSFNQQYALNFKGGNNQADYFLSMGYDNNKFNQAGNDQKRFTLNLNTNCYPFERLKVNIGINYTNTLANNNSPIEDIVGKSASIYPYADLGDSQGGGFTVLKDYSASYKAALDPAVYLDWDYRPLDELHNLDRTSVIVDNRVNLGASYQIWQDLLSLDVKYQYQGQSNSAESYYSEDTYYTRNLINRFIQEEEADPYAIPKGGILQQYSGGIGAHRGRIQVNFNKDWSSLHKLDMIVGGEINQAVSSGSGHTTYGYTKSKLTYENVDFTKSYLVNPEGTSLIPNSLQFNKYTDRYLSYYANGSYIHKERYILSASGRIDKSNLFGVNTNQKAVPLYSAGLMWDLSKETFYKVDWLPYVRLRTTYGYNGNVNKDVTAVTTLLNYSGNTWSGTTYSVIANSGNPELRWEKIRMVNFGVDFGLIDNILAGSAEYYFKKGTDLFGKSPLPGSTGLTEFLGNNADIKGKGLDINLNSRNIHNSNFEWTTNLWLSYVTDKVTKYEVPGTIFSYFNGNNSSLPLEGRSLYAIYAYEWAGLDGTTGAPQGIIDGEVSTDYAAIISDMTLDNLRYVGSSRPTTFGSLRNTLSYKEFSLSLNLIYKLNYYFRRNSIQYSSLYSTWGMHNDYTKRWENPGDEVFTDVPAMELPPVAGNREQFYRFAEVLVEKGDHIRIQDIQFQYTINPKSLKRSPIKNIQLYAYINNVGMLWKANDKGLDPDIYQSYNRNPLPRTYAFGLRGNF